MKSKNNKNEFFSFYLNNNELNKKEYNFKNNVISTTKYNILTFIPLSLLYQFMRLANCYFLFTAILSCIKIITPVASATALFPIIFVLCVSLVRELLEDIYRYKMDRAQNKEPTLVYKNKYKNFVQIESGELEIGEIVMVNQDEIFPSDMILINSSLNEGLCYIETGSLDGEKSLKMKQSNLETTKIFSIENVQNFGEIKGKIFCDKPNPLLYHLQGKIEIEFNGNKHIIPLNVKQLLLKGAKLKNTKFIFGIVLYTGNHNKIMLNSNKPKMKYSSKELLMNKFLIAIFLFQTFLCLFCAILHGIYYNKYLKNNFALNKMDVSNISLDSFINWFSYLLLYNTMIPISLIVTMEIVRGFQALFIHWDIEGYSSIRDKYIQPHNISLNDELGIVDYIFSDKTGTLTCNKMEFKFSVINGKLFNRFEFNYDNDYYYENYWKALSLCHNCQIDENGNFIGLSPDNIELLNASKKSGYKFCNNPNNLISIKRICVNEKNNFDFEILNFFEFTSERKRESVIIRDSQDNNKIKLYIKGADNVIKERLNENLNKKFIVDRTQNYVDKFSSYGLRTLFIAMKIIKEEEYEEIKNNINQFNLSLKANKDTIFEEYVSNNIENDLILLGATIVEDKLQDDVNDTIKSLQLANIKIWMLTGDKMSTAFNIALSCNLLQKSSGNENNNNNNENNNNNNENNNNNNDNDNNNNENNISHNNKEDNEIKENGIDNNNNKNFLSENNLLNKLDNNNNNNNNKEDMKIFYIEGIEIKRNNSLEITNQEEIEKVIINFAKEFNKYKETHNINRLNNSSTPFNFGILIDSLALTSLFNNQDLQHIFINIAKDARSVICCRVTPLQKSLIVKMVKDYMPDKTTLAIGDGGNDVSMIMEANIGIGIHGEEGMRAVQSSDYAIGEFRILKRLLLYQGRLMNFRMCDMMLFFFYKNFLVTIMHFFFSFYSNFSAQTIIDDWLIGLYNLLLTAFPLGARAVYEIDIDTTDGELINKFLPKLYYENKVINDPFTIKKFILTILRGVLHGIINYFFTIYIIGNNAIDKEGYLACLWFISSTLYTNVLIIVTNNLIINTFIHTWIHIALISGCTFLAYIIILSCVHYNFKFGMNAIFKYYSVGTYEVFVESSRFWLSTFIVCGICFLMDLTIRFYQINLSNSLRGYLVRTIKKNNYNLNNENMIKNFKAKQILKEFDSFNTKFQQQRNENSQLKKLSLHFANGSEEALNKIENIHKKFQKNLKEDISSYISENTPIIRKNKSFTNEKK